MSKAAKSKSTETTTQIVLAGHPTKIPPGVKVVDKVTPKQIYVSEPIRETYAVRGQSFTNYNSKGGFLDEEGKVQDLYLRFPRQSFCYVSYQRELGAAKDDTTMDKVKGAQISYPLIENLQAPTEEESDNIASLKAIFDKVVERSKQFYDDDKLPDNVAGMFSQSLKKTKSCKGAVKPFSMPRKNKEGKIQTDKSEAMYLKLATKGKTKDLRIVTRFYNSKGKEVDGATLVNKPINSEPCVKFDGVYWGSHGTTSYGASLKFLVVETNFSPSEGSSKLPTFSLLGNRASASAESDDSDEDEEEEREGGVPATESEGFRDPEESEANTTSTTEDEPSSKKDKKEKEEPKSSPLPKKKKASTPVTIDSDEESTPTPPPKSTPTKKQPKSKSKSSKSTSDDDEEVKAPVKKKAQPKREDSDDEEVKPSKGKKKSTKKKVADDEGDE